MGRSGSLLGDCIGLGNVIGGLSDSWYHSLRHAEQQSIFKARWNVVRIRASGWNRELRELHTRYDGLLKQHEASPFSDGQIAEILSANCVHDAFEELGIDDPPDHLTDPMIAVTRDLLVREVFFTFPNIDWNVALSLEQGVALRRYLDAKERFLQNPIDQIDTWARTISNVWYGLLGQLPEQALLEAEQATPMALSVTLADTASDTPEFVERLIGTIFNDTLVTDGLFDWLRDQLERNLYAASGLDFEEGATTKQLVRPTHSNLSSTAAAEAYLVDTAFAELLQLELPIAISTNARFEHCHIVGGSGHGKTQLLQLLIHRDLEAARDDGPSVVVIDSQGDLIRTISYLEFFDRDAANSLADKFMLIDPNDIEFPVALNMFDVNMERINSFPALEREKILNGTIELYEYIFGALLGAELTQKQGLIFRYLARLMMVIPGATIQTLRELLEDGARFKQHFAKLDGSSRHFFETEYLSPSFKATKTQALRRLWGVLSNPTFERMFSHKENKVDLFEAMNSGKIILINTAKDLLKQEGCEIFGRFFIAMIAQAALQRAAIAENERRDTFVYVDEAHDNFDDNIENLLNQARKYRVGLTLAHQNLDQLSAGLRASMMSSTSIKLVGGLSSKDAKTFAPDMRTDAQFLQSMRKSRSQTDFACYVRNQTETALKVSVPLGVVNREPQLAAEVFEELLGVNRDQYCSPVDEVVFHSVDPADDQPVKPEPQQPPEIQQKGEPADTGHRQLQLQLKHLAQARNFAATIEVPVLEGAGSADVVIDAGGHAIACEISATTRPEHELQNAEKCLAAGFSEVWMIAADPSHLEAVRAHIALALDFADLKRVRFLSPDEAEQAIASLP